MNESTSGPGDGATPADATSPATLASPDPPTRLATPAAPAAPTSTEDPEVADPGLRVRGRSFLLALYKTLRSIKLYPIENAQARGSLDELASATSEILTVNGRLELKISSDLLYVNDARLRLDVDNFASFGHVISALSRAGIGVIRIDDAPSEQEWKTFVTQPIQFEPEGEDEHLVYTFQKLILDRSVTNIMVGSPVEGEAEFADELARKRTYQQSVTVTKDLFDSARLGRAPQLKQVRHAVQGIVDQVLTNEVTLVGLSTLRDFDDYTFTHTVNVCIFSVAIGRRLGLSKARLFDLGMAALLHDVGKSRIDVDIIMKEGKLTDEEFVRMQAHTWLGALRVFTLREFGEIPLRGMVTAYEHHMKVDFSGYPQGVRSRELSVFSKIVAVADSYDAATTARRYSDVKTGDVVLRELWEDPGYDPVLVKALINLLGIYPVGTCVILDTFEVGLVHAANSDATQVNRPVVRVLSDADGRWLDDPTLVDLAETKSDGSFSRSIIKVTDPDKYLINVSDHFV